VEKESLASLADRAAGRHDVLEDDVRVEVSQLEKDGKEGSHRGLFRGDVRVRGEEIPSE
jgi:hypothetical protein